MIEIVRRFDAMWNVWQRIDFATMPPTFSDSATEWQVVHVADRRYKALEWAKRNGLI